MRWLLVGVLSAFCLAVGLGGVTAIGQAVPGTVAEHVAAAKAAGGELWPNVVGPLCGAAERAPAPQQARPPTRQGPPPRDQWYQEPVKVFDNLYLFPTGSVPQSDVTAWAVTTSNGIILIDGTYDYSVADLIDSGMKKLGLDPTQIKDILVTHGHGDHAAGVKYLQDRYSPHVFLSAADWDLMARPATAGGMATPAPKKDMVVTDAQKVTLGDTTITVYVTPGHTPGTISLLIPVRINGTPHLAALWGGAAISRSTGIENLKLFSASAKRFEEIVTNAKADIVISNHDRWGEHLKKIAAMKANPGRPNPFIVGTDGVKRFMQVLQHCSQAIAVAVQ